MASPDDTAYQDNPYGVSDPTAMFQQFSKDNSQNYQTGGINQGLMVAGLNPAMQHSRAVQSNLSAILAANPAEEGEDPYDTQIRQARAVAAGMNRLDPNIAMRADQQIIRLSQAKAQMAKLGADTAQVKQETSAAQAKEGADPMVWVQQGKDQFGLPSYQQIGQGTPMMNPDGSYNTGWSNQAMDELQKNGGMQPGRTQMRQSQYLQLVERTGEGRNIAMMARIQAQTQLQLMGRMSDQTIDDLATSIHDRDRPPQEMPVSRDPVSKMNYDRLVQAYDAKYGEGAYASVDKSDFAVNTKTYNEFGPGISGQRVQNFNVALTHANLLREYASRMKADGSMPDVPFLNYFQTMWQQAGGKPAPTTFDAMKDFVADEWGQAIISSRGGATLTDREKAQDKLSRNASAEQIGSVLDGWQALGGGQLDGLERRFKSSLQGVPADKADARWQAKLSPEARAEYYKTSGGRTAPPLRNPGDTGAITAPVRMVSPDGKLSGLVPAASVAEAERNGWKRK